MGATTERRTVTLGVDVGTSSTTTREHAVERPADELYSLYRELCTSTAATVHALAARERRTTGTSTEELR